MKIGICNDHAGVEYKKKLVKMLRERGHEVINYGTDSEVSCDYPDFAHRLAQAVERKEVEIGIALCGTGNGMAITLNKHQGIRAGLAWSSEVGRLVKAHNNANVLAVEYPLEGYGYSHRFTSDGIGEYLGDEYPADGSPRHHEGSTIDHNA